jgi:hypothetical protein
MVDNLTKLMKKGKTDFEVRNNREAWVLEHPG